MYDAVFAKDPMSAEAGQRYRKEILEVGGSRCVDGSSLSSLPQGVQPNSRPVTYAHSRAHRDEMDSLVAFLGRKPTNEAFLKHLLSGQ